MVLVPFSDETPRGVFACAGEMSRAFGDGYSGDVWKETRET
jgi:hypothetical protein